MPVVPTIPNAVLVYLKAFNLSAVVQTRDGRLTVSRDPSGRDAEQVWWCCADDVGRLVTLARKIDGAEIAADKLGVAITEHSVVMARAQAAVEKIEARLAKAHARGDLSFINKEFRRRRLAAAAAGETFPPFIAVQARLRHALGATIAGDPRSLISQVFGPQ